MAKAPSVTKALIFCGGVGTRMWPMSRKANPKQFQLLVGDKSMFQITVERVLKGFNPQDVFVSTGTEYLNFIHQQAPSIPDNNIITEPARRDTLGAVGLANEIILRRYPNAVIAAIWGADHIVKNEDEFNLCIKLAADYSATHNKLVKIDVRPTFPSTHNGWVKMGRVIEKIEEHPVHQFISFIEKPNYEKAKQLYSDQNNLINTGYLVWPAKLMHQLYKQYQPKITAILNKIGDEVGTSREKQTIIDQYPRFPKISVDYGIFEKLDEKNTVIIPANLGWTDTGTWQLLFQGLVEDPEVDNLTKGEVELLEVQKSLVYSNVKGKLVSVIGLNNVCVVDTKDGLVVCDLHHTDEIKKLVDRLESKELNKYL